MAYEAITSLPAEVLQRLDLALTKGGSTGAAAKQLKADGYFPNLNAESLARTLRNYKRDRITLHEVSRREALARTKNPATRKALREMIDAYQMHADWVNLLNHRKVVYEKAAEAVKNAPGVAALSDTLRRAARDLHDMYRDHTRFLMDAGLIPRAAQHVHITSEQIVIGSDRDAMAVLEALISYVGRNPEDRYLSQAAHSVASMLTMREALADCRAIVNDDEPKRLPLPRPEPVTFPEKTVFRPDDPE